MTRLRSPSVAVSMSLGTLLGQEAGSGTTGSTVSVKLTRVLVQSALVALVEAKQITP